MKNRAMAEPLLRSSALPACILGTLVLCLVAAAGAAGQEVAAFLERIEQADVDWNPADVDPSDVPAPWGPAAARTIPTVKRRVCLNAGTYVLTLRANVNLLPDGGWLAMVALQPEHDDIPPLPGQPILLSSVTDDPRTGWRPIIVDEPACYELHVFGGRVGLYSLRVRMRAAGPQ